MNRSTPWSWLPSSLCLALVALGAACSGPASGDPDADSGTGADADLARLDQVIGGVQVRDQGHVPVWIWESREWPAPGAYFGVVGEGMWEVAVTASDCVYLTAIVPGFCDPACDSQSYCDQAGVCPPWPPRVDAGIMELDGLAADATMIPDADHYYPHHSRLHHLSPFLPCGRTVPEIPDHGGGRSFWPKDPLLYRSHAPLVQVRQAGHRSGLRNEA